VDIRLVAATNKNLSQEVQENRFRQDLLYRVNTIVVEIPPLRERTDDIPLLVEHFTTPVAGQRRLTVSPAVMELLCEYHWPGNVRELKNVVERALVLASEGQITPECLPVEIYNKKKLVVPSSKAERAPSGQVRSLADLEKDQILATLNKVNWHRGKAATLLGITPKTLYRKLRSYNLESN
jgi:DNA-binding NtrC family response regulator